MPFRFGIWVKGDGSNSRLIGNFLDFSDLSDFYYGGWKRTWESMREICRLNFTGWRYFEVGLPGNGIGTNTVRGSTDEIDFPIELTALVVLPEPILGRRDQLAAAKGQNVVVGAIDASNGARMVAAQAGTIQIGPMYAYTQQTTTTTLAAMIAYDDPALDYGPKNGAWVSIQNAWRTGSRTVTADWTLSDKNNKVIVGGNHESEIPAGEIGSFRIELADHAADIEKSAGPLRLKVVATDKQEPTITATTLRSTCRSRIRRFCWRTSNPTADTSGLAAMGSPMVPRPGATAGRRGLPMRPPRASLLPARPPPSIIPAPARSKSSGTRRRTPRASSPSIRRSPASRSMSPSGSKGTGPARCSIPSSAGRRACSPGLRRTSGIFSSRAPWGAIFRTPSGSTSPTGGEFTFHFQPVPSNFDKPLPVLHFLPSYPQGLHLGVDAREATGNSGAIYVDDIIVHTLLGSGRRMDLALRRDAESNVVLLTGPSR